MNLNRIFAGMLRFRGVSSFFQEWGFLVVDSFSMIGFVSVVILVKLVLDLIGERESRLASAKAGDCQ